MTFQLYLNSLNTEKHLSKNFTMTEFINDRIAISRKIDNRVPKDQGTVASNLLWLATQVLQPIRDKYTLPIVITSGYRSPELNQAVGGSDTSAHLKGLAVDIRPLDPMDLPKLTRLVIDMTRAGDIPLIDQLIDSKGFIHLGYTKDKEPRGELLNEDYKFMASLKPKPKEPFVPTNLSNRSDMTNADIKKGFQEIYEDFGKIISRL